MQWPLDKRPPYYASQGDRFSDILHMLLKMRGLPPKTTPRPENGILKAIDGSDENAIRWFDTIKVTRKFHCLITLSWKPHLTSVIAQFLEQRQSAEFDPNDSRSLELKYGARLLMPANAYN